jgi:hypothetical protein
MTRRLWWFLGVAMLAGCGRTTVIENDVPYLQQVQKIAVDGNATLHIYSSPISRNSLGPGNCNVEIRISGEGESRGVDLWAPTCEQAAKLVVERLAKP